MSEYDPKLLNDKLEQCAKELPEGYRIVLSVEKSSGWVDLEVPPYGESVEYPCNREYGFMEQVTDAFDYALEHAKKQI